MSAWHWEVLLNVLLRAINFVRCNMAIKTSSWPCCCVSSIVHDHHPPSPSLHLLRLRLSDSWFSIGADAASCDVKATAPIHARTWALYSASHLRWGQFLHLQTPLKEEEERKRERKITRIRLSCLHLRHIFFAPAPTRCGHSGFVQKVVFFWFEGGVRVWADRFFWGRGRKRCGLCSFISSVPLLDPKSMGAQISKTAGKEEAAVEKAAEGAAVAAKTNGQVNII